MSSLLRPHLSPGEYLTIERRSECRSEYFDGEMIAMTGASRKHNLIVVNVTRELTRQLKGTSLRIVCE